jgi:hypothetical protein
MAIAPSTTWEDDEIIPHGKNDDRGAEGRRYKFLCLYIAHLTTPGGSWRREEVIFEKLNF